MNVSYQQSINSLIENMQQSNITTTVIYYLQFWNIYKRWVHVLGQYTQKDRWPLSMECNPIWSSEDIATSVSITILNYYSHGPMSYTVKRGSYYTMWSASPVSTPSRSRWPYQARSGCSLYMDWRMRKVSQWPPKGHYRS